LAPEPGLLGRHAHRAMQSLQRWVPLREAGQRILLALSPRCSRGYMRFVRLSTRFPFPLRLA